MIKGDKLQVGKAYCDEDDGVVIRYIIYMNKYWKFQYVVTRTEKYFVSNIF